MKNNSERVNFLGKIEKPTKINVDSFDFKNPEHTNNFMDQWYKNGLINLKKELKAQYNAGIIDENGNRIKKS